MAKKNNYDNFLAYPPRDNRFENEIPVSDRKIPYGDYFLSSCTFQNYQYFKTNLGYFKRLNQSKNIETIEKKEFDEAYSKREFFVFCPRLGSPQAGLTRGFKRSFSQNEKILSDLQNKYKDGIK
ncbi:hypothetical protein [Sulfuricurvum sp.]|uniref:hypothetical protein n=1 Tax=Sulfuricurvum sp. TaxID=2025608 RepID=UPI0026270B83|nr:hypothetical protein [Sulfuricurvum sp.]MDD4949634.1 hypothetical protein [Sulfuricurvum sp.]